MRKAAKILAGTVLVGFTCLLLLGITLVRTGTGVAPVAAAPAPVAKCVDNHVSDGHIHFNVCARIDMTEVIILP